MRDLHDRYLGGVNDLLQVIEPEGEVYLNVLTLQGRLAQAISDIKQYGPTDNAQAEIARVTSELDKICLENLEEPFYEFCGIGSKHAKAFNSIQIYHNLPQPDYDRFIGREEELKKVFKLLSPRSRHFLVTIDGIGGIGKSTLALEVAHRYLHNKNPFDTSEQFDALIWASAKQTVLTAEGIVSRGQILRTLYDIYTTISVTLEREDITRAKPEDQYELVRHALTQQRTLLIVDNLETVDDEATLSFLRELPAPTKAIVTTRHRIDIAYPVRLTGMPQEDGLNLISQECERRGVELKKAEAEKLYHRTGGVPLAIVWSVAQMGYGYDVEAVLRRLGQPVEDIAFFCFEGSFEHIRGTDSHKLLMALALLETDASREALGYVAGLEEDVLSREEGLVQLEKLSLINRSGGRFSLLPLTRQFVQHEIDKSTDFAVTAIDAWKTWLDRHLDCQDYYWTWLGAKRIQDEINVVFALLDWAEEHKSESTTIRFIRPALFNLQITGRRGQGLHLADRGLKIANKFGIEYLLSWLEMYKGWVLTQQDDISLAINRLKIAKQQYKMLKDQKGLSLTISFIGQAKRKSRDLYKVEEMLLNALGLAEQQGFVEGQLVALYELGKLARDLEKWDKAYQYLLQAYELLDPPELYGNEVFLAILGNLGLVTIRLGHYSSAKEYCLESLSRLRGPDQVTSFGIRLHLWLSEAEMNLGEYTNALNYAEQAIEAAQLVDARKYLNKARDLVSKILSRTQ